MNKPTEHLLMSSQSFIIQQYEMIDYEILNFEKKLEEMELLGHCFCSTCCVEISINQDLCERCDL